MIEKKQTKQNDDEIPDDSNDKENIGSDAHKITTKRFDKWQPTTAIFWQLFSNHFEKCGWHQSQMYGPELWTYSYGHKDNNFKFHYTFEGT